MIDKLIRYALQYSELLGWKVFPVKEDKKPCTPHGFKDAVSNPQGIEILFTRYPEAGGIGVATGKESGIFVVDVDGKQGKESLKNLLKENGELPHTVMQYTGSGWYHLFFKYPVDTRIKNSASQIATGIDIRGEGGYVVVPPSKHPSGKTYGWREFYSPEEHEIAPAPGWLIQLCITPKKRKIDSYSQNTTGSTPYGEAALLNQLEHLKSVQPGSRNHALNKVAFSLGQLVAGGELDESRVAQALQIAGSEIGLENQEVDKTIRSGIESGKGQPKSAPDKKQYVSRDKNTHQNITVLPWEEPIPLIRELPPARQFPVHALPGLIGETVEALVDMVQVPASLAAGSVLAASSYATQALADIVLPFGGNSTRPLSLYFISIAASSDRKSTVDSIVLEGILQHQKALYRKYESELEAYKTEESLFSKIHQQILNESGKKSKDAGESVLVEGRQKIEELGDRPLPPLEPFLLIPEPTMEGMTLLFARGQPSLALFSNEGALMLFGHSMQKEKRLNTAGMLSTLWDGQAISRIRAGDINMLLPGRRLAIHLMVQPRIGRTLFSDSELEDQGFLSRLLVVAPESKAGSREFRDPQAIEEHTVARFSERIRELLQSDYPLEEGKRNELKPRRLTFTSEAKPIWVNFSNEIEGQIGKGGEYESIKGFAGKLAEQAARIAGVFSVMQNQHCERIEGETMQQACTIARFYGGEALRLFQAGKVNPHLEECEKVLDWIFSSWDEGYISPPDIYQLAPGSVRDRRKAKKILATLENHAWIVREPEGAVTRGIKRKEAYRIRREFWMDKNRRN
ncbi:DUF3987 domain-containing protein [bacterium]|nr:DUF3987 domain-containing protein [bacterium]